MKCKFFLSLLIVVIGSLVAEGQSLKTWTWDMYKMKFKLPSNMVVQESNENKFQASNNAITLDIYPRKGENLTYSGMKSAIVNWASQTSLRYDEYDRNGYVQPIYLSNLNRYWGCAIDGRKEGSAASILLLVDPDFSDISFYIWISYWDEYYYDAVQILKSFEPK
jgi:hypothetical protein